MKRPLFSVFIIASLMVAIAHCFPSAPFQEDSIDKSRKDNLDTVLLLPGQNPLSFSRPLFRIPELPNFGDVNDDDDSLESFNPFKTSFNPLRGSPFDSFLESVQSVMNRIQEQMAGVLSGLPGQGAFGLGGKIPEGGNTTSTTKIIDGHVVTVNETTYQNADNDSNVVLRVQIVDVQPLNGTTAGGNDNEAEADLGGGEEIETLTTQVNETPDKTGEETTTTQEPRSVETVEDSAGNEIPNKDDKLKA